MVTIFDNVYLKGVECKLQKFSSWEKNFCNCVLMDISDHSTIHTNFESLSYMPEASMSYFNYISIKNTLSQSKELTIIKMKTHYDDYLKYAQHS